MKVKTSKLRDAIAFALAVSATSLLATMPASAQETDSTSTDGSVKSLDAISVTGSRIKSQTMTSSSPVTEISGESFQQTGATKVEDLVNQYPQLDLSFDNMENNPSTGYATASLRQLGAARTLTLVNGRRMPGGTSETTDLSIIPTALVKRVDVLTGGASAVFGADAVAGVVDFKLDDEFEGISFNAGYNGYQHTNDYTTAQNFETEAGFTSPNGNTGLDGISRNFDLAVGKSFAGGAGHVVGYLTYRKNNALMQDARDYSACSVSAYGEGCLGSSTADPGNLLVGGKWYVADGDGSYSSGHNYYNFAPENYYQRPDERHTAGFMAKYEVNSHFVPYAEALFVDRKSSMQIAETGTFGYVFTADCDASYIGSLCADTGNANADSISVGLYKRNVEGGPRITETDTRTYRVTAGAKGEIAGSWSYDAYALYGKTHSTTKGKNDWLYSRIADAVAGCPEGSFSGCEFYDIWTGNISTSAADALASTSYSEVNTTLKVLSAYATGNLGFGTPWANDEELGLVVGAERRITSFSTQYDADSLAGNFAGAGSSSSPVDAEEAVNDFYTEVAAPLVVAGSGFFNRLDAQLGYRHSKYDLSGGANTYKIGLSAAFLDNTVLLRGGYNRAIRAPSLNDLYYPSVIALDGSVDYCEGTSPSYTAEQCARTGLPTSAYGTIPDSSAGQYYGLVGGNADLKPEVADTYTLGVAWEPIKNLNLALDWYSIEIKDAISQIGYSTIQVLCMEKGLYCDMIHRYASTDYSLWEGTSTASDVGYIDDLSQNIGIEKREGLDLNASYSFDLGPGRMNVGFVGTYVLKSYTQTLADDSSTGYECKGKVNTECFTPKWRHVANARYSWDRYDVGLRWRYIGSTAFRDAYTGEKLTADDNIWLARHGGVGSYSYFDLSASVNFDVVTWTIGVNNVADRSPPFVGYDGGINSGTSNSLDGYDQVGRYLFTSLNIRF